MNKKILIGSIGAAIILILVSITSVVGFQSAEFSVEKASPLFESRVTKANGQNDKLEANYLGKGRKADIDLPKIQEINGILDKIVNVLNEKSELSIEKLQNAVERIRKNSQLLQGLKNVLNINIKEQKIERNLSDEIQKVFENQVKGINNAMTRQCFTVVTCIGPTCLSSPLCLIGMVIGLVAAVLLTIPLLPFILLTFGISVLFTVIWGCIP